MEEDKLKELNELIQLRDHVERSMYVLTTNNKSVRETNTYRILAFIKDTISETVDLYL